VEEFETKRGNKMIEKGKPWFIQNRMHGIGRGFSGRKEDIRHYKVRGFVNFLADHHNVKLAITGKMLKKGKSKELELVASFNEKEYYSSAKKVYEISGALTQFQRTEYAQDEPENKIYIKMKPEFKEDVALAFKDADVDKIKYLSFERKGLKYKDNYTYDDIKSGELQKSIIFRLPIEKGI